MENYDDIKNIDEYIVKNQNYMIDKFYKIIDLLDYLDLQLLCANIEDHDDYDAKSIVYVNIIKKEVCNVDYIKRPGLVFMTGNEFIMESNKLNFKYGYGLHSWNVEQFFDNKDYEDEKCLTSLDFVYGCSEYIFQAEVLSKINEYHLDELLQMKLKKDLESKIPLREENINKRSKI